MPLCWVGSARPTKSELKRIASPEKKNLLPKINIKVNMLTRTGRLSITMRPSGFGWIASRCGIRAYYAWITGDMRQYSPNLEMSYTRALGDELFEMRARGKEGIVCVFYWMVGAVMSSGLWGFFFRGSIKHWEKG